MIIQSEDNSYNNKKFVNLIEYFVKKITESSDPYSYIVLTPWYLRLGYSGQAIGLTVRNKALSLDYDEKVALSEEENLKNLEDRMKLLKIASMEYRVKKAEEDYNLILTTRRADIEKLIQENNIEEASIILQKLVDIGTIQESLMLIDFCNNIYNNKRENEGSTVFPFSLFRLGLQYNSQDEGNVKKVLFDLHNQLITKVLNTGTINDFEYAVGYYLKEGMQSFASVLLATMEHKAHNGTMEDKRDALFIYNRFQDRKKEKEWQELLEKSAQTVEDKRLLAYWYQEGIALQKDRKKAESYYKLAEQQAEDMGSLDIKRALAYS